ncbi:MAG TPA: acyltransferase [bacterium]|nr:acyltransferase [bacterium]
MRVGVFQFSPEFGNVRANLDRIDRALSGVRADLIVLPELCTTGYQFTSREEVRTLSEPVPDGPAVRRLAGIARRDNVFLVAGLAEKDGDLSRNSSVLIGPEGPLGTYRKTHLFYREQEWFAPGDTGFSVQDTGPARIGMMVCYDWMFPEAARTLALKGADILCHPANLVMPFCPDAMVTRSIENRVFSVTANRTGSESRQPGETLTFIGRSQIVTPGGETLFRMDREEGVRIVDIDPALARDKRIHKTNHLWDDRRTECYGVKSEE